MRQPSELSRIRDDEHDRRQEALRQRWSLPERLRRKAENGAYPSYVQQIFTEAADEIDRLRHELDAERESLRLLADEGVRPW